MCRFRTRGRRSDDGFTLIEVMVALAIFALFTTAVVPLLITALRASSVAKLDTGARNLAQERLEKMRTLPFHTSQSSGAGADLLDTYFPGTSPAATGVDVAGFVAAGATRKAGEPSGALYRYLVPASEMAPSPLTSETFSRYTQRVATQFLNANGQPFAPTTWDSLSSPADEAVPSFIVRATVTTTWKAGSLTKSYTVSSNIGEGRSAPAVARGEVRATGLRVTSSLPDPVTLELSDLLLDAAVVTVDGTVGRGAKVAASARGALASLVPGSRVEGASGGATSPTNGAVTPLATGPGPRTLSFGGSEVVHFGDSDVLASTTSADGGQMRAGTSTAPVGATVKTGSFLRFSNLPDLVAPDLGIDNTRPVVFSDSSGGKRVEATARLVSTGTSNHSVVSAATAKAPVFGVLPTSFAPDGLLRVELSQAALGCSAGVASVAPTLTYAATVQYWRYDPSTGTSGYAPTALTLSHTDTTDLLAGLMSTPVKVTGSGSVLTYASFFKKLSSATAASLASERTVTTAGHAANHTGLLTLSTVSLRQGVDSSVTAQFGVLSCSVEDAR